MVREGVCSVRRSTFSLTMFKLKTSLILILLDDDLLRFYYNKYKGSWSEIAKELPGRDNRACYNRYESTLKKWEIDGLKENYKYYGNHWNLLIKDLEGRTPLQAKNYFYGMKKPS
ncbi:336_t:CDS:2, partial [Paraglomus brasilianum]